MSPKNTVSRLRARTLMLRLWYHIQVLLTRRAERYTIPFLKTVSCSASCFMIDSPYEITSAAVWSFSTRLSAPTAPLPFHR